MLTQDRVLPAMLVPTVLHMIVPAKFPFAAEFDIFYIQFSIYVGFFNINLDEGTRPYIDEILVFPNKVCFFNAM